MKTFEVTFDNGETHTIKVDDWKSVTESVIESLKKIDNSGLYEPWTVMSIIQRREENGETI